LSGTPANIARLESGRLKPTTRTLEQFAKATRTCLRISFEPDKAAHWAGAMAPREGGAEGERPSGDFAPARRVSHLPAFDPKGMDAIEFTSEDHTVRHGRTCLP
jgi:hypothetical protein